MEVYQSLRYGTFVVEVCDEIEQCLGGEALESVSGLEHTPRAYKAALELLDWQYGGKRRNNALILNHVKT